jgi:CHAD domain-containing protein
LLDRLVSAAREPVVGEDRASAAPDVAAVMQPVWRRLAQTASSLGRQPSDAELHAVRIRTKRARYAAEALAPVAGKAARRFADRAAELQDVLGEHQDAVVAEAWLRRSIGRGRRASFVAGELVAAERAAAEAAAAAWPAAWDTLDRKRIRFW